MIKLTKKCLAVVKILLKGFPCKFWSVQVSQAVLLDNFVMASTRIDEQAHEEDRERRCHRFWFLVLFAFHKALLQ